MTTEISEGSAAAQPVWVKGAGVASLVLGIGLGLLTLSSVAGIWFGLWDFRRGFALLGTANKYGNIVAWICVALAVVLVLVNRTSARKGSGKFVALAILGTLTPGELASAIALQDKANLITQVSQSLIMLSLTLAVALGYAGVF